MLHVSAWHAGDAGKAFAGMTGGSWRVEGGLQPDGERGSRSSRAGLSIWGRRDSTARAQSAMDDRLLQSLASHRHSAVTSSSQSFSQLSWPRLSRRDKYPLGGAPASGSTRWRYARASRRRKMRHGAYLLSRPPLRLRKSPQTHPSKTYPSTRRRLVRRTIGVHCWRLRSVGCVFLYHEVHICCRILVLQTFLPVSRVIFREQRMSWQQPSRSHRMACAAIWWRGSMAHTASLEGASRWRSPLLPGIVCLHDEGLTARGYLAVLTAR